MSYTVFFDLETGGVEMRHPVIQLAAVAVDDDWNESSAFEQKIAFDIDACDMEALRLNHYTPEAWKDAVVREAALARFVSWLRPYQSLSLLSKRTGNPYSVAKLAGYNALTFDLPRLKAMFGAEFTPWDPRVRDVLQRALFWFDEHPETPKPENFKLATVAEMFGIASDGAHDALADARMSAALAKALRDAD